MCSAGLTRAVVVTRSGALRKPVAVLDELDPIAKRVGGVEARHVRQAVIRHDRHPGGGQRPPTGLEIVDDQRRMGLAGRREVLLDAKVDGELDVIEAENSHGCLFSGRVGVWAGCARPHTHPTYASTHLCAASSSRCAAYSGMTLAFGEITMASQPLKERAGARAAAAFGGDVRTTNLDLLLATTIALGLPFACAWLWERTGGATASLALYYLVC